MDTKSKNIKYSYGTKVVAFFIALALVVSSGILIASNVELMMKYASDDYLSIVNKTEFYYTDSIAFENELNTNLENLYKIISNQDYKEYVSGTYCTREDELAKASNYYDAAFQNSNNNYNSITMDYDENDELVTRYNFSSTYEMKISKDDIQFSDSTAKDDFLKEVASNYDAEILTATRDCANDKQVAQNTLKTLVNFKYIVTNTNTGEIISNVPVGSITPETKGWYFIYTADSGVVNSSFEPRKATYFSNKTLDQYFGNKDYDVSIAVPAAENLVEGDNFYDIAQECASIKNNFTKYSTIAAILLAISFVLSVYLVMVSGRTNNSDKASLSWVDKIPTDIHFVLSWGSAIALAACAIAAIDELWNSLNNGYYSQSEAYLLIFCEAGLLGAFWAVIVEWASHISRYYKTGRKYVRHSIIGIVFIAFIKFCKEVFSAIIHVFGFAPKKLKKRAFYVMLAYVAVNFILAIFLAAGINNGGAFLFMLMCMVCANIIMLTLMWKYLVALDEIVDASEKGKGAETPTKIKSDNFPEPLKSLADNLYVTQDEMKKAVDEAIKGERMKTELITNVSHDLKTPLTSIISYVDLLKKCDIDDIQAQRYITVLDEKSIRLKRLIEDLVEASKVSSGVVTFNKMNVNLNELTVQAIAEVEDAFSANNLEIVFDESAASPVIFADSQKTWRVIDNLLSNARKYSLAGSRIYIEVGQNDKNGYFSIKNVSHQPLNINSEELTQRFVRGDSARSNEGSGLGLSIAKDLCSLQGGKLTIDIDGDLFKATIELPLAKVEPVIRPSQPQSTIDPNATQKD